MNKYFFHYSVVIFYVLLVVTHTSVQSIKSAADDAAADTELQQQCQTVTVFHPPIHPKFNTCEVVPMNTGKWMPLNRKFFRIYRRIWNSAKCMNSTMGAWKRHMKFPFRQMAGSADELRDLLRPACHSSSSTTTTTSASPHNNNLRNLIQTTHVFTILSRTMGNSCLMLRSAQYNGIPLNVYGWPTDNSSPTRPFVLMDKLQLSLDVLSSLEDNSFALFVDGSDVLFRTNMSCIWSSFLLFRSNVVFGAEACCSVGALGHPRNDCPSFFPYVHSPWRFFNSGTFMGKVFALKALFKRAIGARWNQTTNDQDILGEGFVHLQRHLKMRLDTHGVLFQSAIGSKSFFRCSNSLVNCLTGTHANIFHFPAKQDVIYGAKRMWWWRQNDATLIINDKDKIFRMNGGSNIFWSLNDFGCSSSSHSPHSPHSVLVGTTQHSSSHSIPVVALSSQPVVGR
jgi:hypothetical protein